MKKIHFLLGFFLLSSVNGETLPDSVESSISNKSKVLFEIQNSTGEEFKLVAEICATDEKGSYSVCISKCVESGKNVCFAQEEITEEHGDWTDKNLERWGVKISFVDITVKVNPLTEVLTFEIPGKDFGKTFELYKLEGYPKRLLHREIKEN